MKKINNIVFMGTPKFAVPTLRALAENNLTPELVITQPDRKKGRGQRISYSPIKKYCNKYSLPVFQPVKLNTKAARERIRKCDPDLIVTAAYGKLIGKKILKLPKFGCINLHPSLLPKYRGPSPINWALFNADKQTGNTVYFMNEKMDAGDIIHQSFLKINPEDNYGILMEKLSKQGAKDILKTIILIHKEKVKIIKQDDTKATYSKLIDKEIKRIDWHKSAIEIENKVRGLAPFPAAFSYLNGKIIKILKAKSSNKKSSKPGEITEIVKDFGFIVGTGSGELLVKKIKPQGKKLMSGFSYSLGHNVIGEKFHNA